MFNRQNRRKLSAQKIELQQLESRLLLTGVSDPFTFFLEVEPNNDRSIAQAIPNTSNVDGSISPFNDVDFYTFALNIGSTISINVQANSTDLPSEQLDPLVGLFDANGSLLAFDDDSGTGSYWAAGLTYTATTNGSVFVGITDYGDSNFNGLEGNDDGFGSDVGNYLLSISSINLNIDNDPDDIEVIIENPLQTQQARTSNPDGDLDFDIVTIARNFSSVTNLDDDLTEDEIIVSDPAQTVAWRSIKLDSDADMDALFVRGNFVSRIDVDRNGFAETLVQTDLDGDGEPEIFVEDHLIIPNSSLIKLDGDLDIDLVITRGTYVGTLDLDGDGEQEALIHDTSLALQHGMRNIDGDSDIDLVFIRGVFTHETDIDVDGETELVIYDPAITLHSMSRSIDTIYGDTDSDLIFYRGNFISETDYDNDGEPELLIQDSLITSFINYNNIDGDGDMDVLVVRGFAQTFDLDSDGEDEIVFQDTLLTRSFMFVNRDLDLDVDFVIVRGVITQSDVDNDGEMDISIFDPLIINPFNRDIDLDLDLDLIFYKTI